MKNQRSVLLGLILMGVGIILLLDNFNVIPGLPYYVFHWANIFFVLSVVNLFSGKYRGAVLFIGLWSFFTLHEFWGWQFEEFWPLIIMVVGLSIILKNKQKQRGGISDDHFFDDVNIFNNGKQVYTNQHLEGGKVTNIFGAGDIDLRRSMPVDGAVIEIFTMFGGCNLIVPPDWNVSVTTTAIFGGFEDKRDTSVAQNGPTLYVKGITIFGGGELRS